MLKKINWKLPLILLVVIGAYYLYSTNFITPKGPLEICADSVVFKRGCARPESACLEINFVFPSIVTGVSSKVPKSILSDYLQMVEDSSGVSTMNEFKNRLVEHAYRFDSTYVDFTNEFPNASYISWYLKVNYEVYRNDGKILTLCYLFTDYMGGAHGMHSYHYQNIDMRKSKMLAFSDVFENMDEFYRIAEASFNEKYLNDKSGEPIGFWFPENRFVLPVEFGFDDDGLILHYNVYEIASYAQGDILLEIPYANLKSVLKERWRYLAEL